MNNVGGSGDKGAALQSIGSAVVEQREPGLLAAGRTNRLPVHDPQRNRAGQGGVRRRVLIRRAARSLRGPTEILLVIAGRSIANRRQHHTTN
jgi:hypothetical protein